VDELRIRADLSAADKVRTFLRRILRPLDWAEEDYFKIELSLHEICVNIVLYAYPADKGDLVLRIWFEGDKAVFQFRDGGIAFDPGRAALPDVWEKITAGKRGGFGIFLYRILMDGFHYERKDGENVLTVFKSIRSAPPPRSV
jgi:anti-sigma regulatory factor (Ser/Thr protein kinase)